MDIVPTVKIERFVQLAPGDLFVLDHDQGTAIALKAADPNRDGDTFIVPLGPTFPTTATGPTLMEPRGITVVSLGKDYRLRLPSRPDGWTTTEPPPETHCIVLTDKGVYVRANFAWPDRPFQPCYIDLHTGQIQSSSYEYRAPTGLRAYAIEWSLLTNEEDARPILSYPRDTSTLTP